MTHLVPANLPSTPLPTRAAGQELPSGVTEKSTVPQLKAALKEWGLPISGSKPDLWQRLLDQVGAAVLTAVHSSGHVSFCEIHL